MNLNFEKVVPEFDKVTSPRSAVQWAKDSVQKNAGNREGSFLSTGETFVIPHVAFEAIRG